MRARLAKATIDRLRPPDGGRLTVWDATVGRFGLRITANGVKTYVVKYRARGRQRFHTVGQHGSPWTAETARKEALRLLGLVAQGQDPAAVKLDARAAPDVAALCDRFVREHVDVKLKASTRRGYRQLLDAVIRPKLGTRRIADLTADDLARLHHAMKGSPYLANRALAVVSKMFVLAERWGLCPRGTNPARGLEKFRERSRGRFLTDDELARLGAVLEIAERTGAVTPEDGAPAVPVSPFVLAAIKLLIFTGARKGEVLALEWHHVDVEHACLRIPVHKTDRAGTKTIPLNVPALAILEALPRLAASPYVFPSVVRDGHLVKIEKAWTAIRTAAGLEGVRPHDLRHAHASVGVSAGVSLPIVGALLGHTQTATTQRYAHLSADPLKLASELIGTRIATAMAARPEGAPR
jgi:integrase